MRLQSISWPSGTWANTALFEFPMNAPNPRPTWVGERATASSGVIDTWEEGSYEDLEGEFLHIPAQDQAGIATGYHGAAGLKAFYLYAMGGGQFRFRVDADDAGTEHLCQLVEGTLEREGRKQQSYRLRFHLRDVDGTEFVI